MAKEKKTRAELAQMMISEARNSGKCADLYDLSISGPHQDQQSNWDYMIIRSGSTRISSVCDAELRIIAGRLQAKYDLSGDQWSEPDT